MIDRDGFRANVGIIVANPKGRVLWAQRAGYDAWQFPQGGMQVGESAEAAMFRELHEEVGLKKEHVRVLGVTKNWLRYRLPEQYIRKNAKPLCVGQKQKWFLLAFEGTDDQIHLDVQSKQEFDAFEWVSYWYPLSSVVDFKQGVYAEALRELLPVYASYMRGGDEVNAYNSDNQSRNRKQARGRHHARKRHRRRKNTAS